MKYSDKTVGEITAENPLATDIFIIYGIDFYCGGKRNFGEACQANGLDPDAVQREMEEHFSKTGQLDQKLANFKTDELVHHVKKFHIEYIRSRQSEITMLAKTVMAENKEKHPELNEISQVVENFFDDMEEHFRYEETVLFPAIQSLIDHDEKGTPVPQTQFESIREPIEKMERAHIQTSKALANLKKLTNNYTAPEYAPVNYQKLYETLRDLQYNTFVYIHLENNILFPRALTLEAKA